jgi:hypothetical protein
MMGETFNALKGKTPQDKSALQNTLGNIMRASSLNFAEANSWLVEQLEEIGYNGGAITARNKAAHGESSAVSSNWVTDILENPNLKNLINAIEKGLASGKERSFY